MTDFGMSDVYVAQMKGVINTINPYVKIIDLTHDINPFDIKQAGFLLKVSYKYFPNKTIFVCVVDPEVGSQREVICIETKDFLFLAPNNGLLTFVLKELQIEKVLKIDNVKFFANEVSHTFHGRDIFASVAGYLSKDINLNEIGSRLDLNKLKIIRNLKVNKLENKVVGEIIYSDRFGNLVTSIHRNDLPRSFKTLKIKIESNLINGISNTFSTKEIGELLAYIGSMEYLEIAIREGKAVDIIDSQSLIEVFWE